MKLRSIVLLTLAAILLSSCSFTLAEDVTPPPDYVSPTPPPTLGPMYPVQTPDTANGAGIYAEKCVPCHGATGMGDGPQGIQLGVTVAALGLPDVARSASPAQWYTTVTRGNIERFMPPFVSLSEQERWDVVAYAMSMHITPDEIEKGRALFESNCKGCSTDFFTNEENMSALSEVELARIIKQGNDQVKAFGSKLSDEETWAVAAYLRTLQFSSAPLAEATLPPTLTPVPATETVAPTEAGTQLAEATAMRTTGTPEGTEQATAVSEATVTAKTGFGTVSGSIDNKSGAALPSDLKVTLRALEHGTDPNAGLQDVMSLDGVVNTDGTFTFQNVEMPVNRIFVAEINVGGVTLQSEFAVVAEGASSLEIPPLVLYGTTSDLSALTMDDVRLFFDYSGTSNVQLFAVYSFHNNGNKTIVANYENGTEIPFIKTPEGAQFFGYQQLTDSKTLTLGDKSIAIPPSKDGYGIVAFFALPKTDKVKISQTFTMPIPALTVFLPEGTRAESTQLADHGIQQMDNFNFQMYAAGDVAAGKTITFTIPGSAQTATSTTTSTETSNTTMNLVIGAGGLGLLLIAAGAWIFLRNRNRVDDIDEEVGDEFESAEEVMDAIIALDDLHRAGKISDEAHLKRRTELKDILKGMM